MLAGYLPEGPKFFPDDMITDRPEMFIVREIIREKALQNIKEEIPHGVGIEILVITSYSIHYTKLYEKTQPCHVVEFFIS